MRLLKATILVFVVCTACKSSLGDHNAPQATKTITHTHRAGLTGVLSSTVTFLYTEQGQPIGTAFIVGYPMPNDPSKAIPLIVTAKHVVAGQKKVIARFKGKAGASAKTVNWLSDLDHLRKEGDYWEHPDPDVDIAVFRTLNPDGADVVAIPMALIASEKMYEDEDVKETDRIVFPSLLVGLQGLSRDYPVVREGSIALLPEEGIPLDGNPNGKRADLVLINAAANQGSSGAPVFLWPGPRLSKNAFVPAGPPLLLGLIKGFFNALPRPVVGIDTATGNRHRLLFRWGAPPAP